MITADTDISIWLVNITETDTSKSRDIHLVNHQNVMTDRNDADPSGLSCCKHTRQVNNRLTIELFMGNPPQSYGTSPVIWDHTVFTCHPTQANAPCLTPVRKAGTRFTYPGGTEG